MDVVILGIDPGTANTGYGVVARSRGRLVALDGGVIGTTAGAELPARLAAIPQGIMKRVVDGTASSPRAAQEGSRARGLADLGWRIAQRRQ